MEKFHVEFEMTQKDELPVEASSFSEAVTKAGESIGPDWRPVSVCDGSEVRYVIGKCEGCLKWITEGDDYVLTSDHCRLCSVCAQTADE